MYCQLKNFRPYVFYWHEDLTHDEFETEIGNPLYKHRDWIYWGFEYNKRINEHFDFYGKFNRHYFLDTRGKGLEFWLGIKGKLEQPFLNK